MKAKLKDIGQDTIITSLAFALLGLVLIMFPSLTIKVISYIIGLFIIVMGLIKIYNYYKSKGQKDIFNNDITYGMLAVVGGIAVIICAPIVTQIFRVIIGLFVIYSGSVKLIFGLKLNEISKKLGRISISSAVVMLICGLIILFYYNSIMVALGITLLVFAIMNLLEGIIYIRNVDTVYKKIKEDKVIIEEE